MGHSLFFISFRSFVPCEKNKQLIIAIDGYSSCGKSTLAKDLAHTLQYTYLDSGAMYRAVTLYFLDNNISFDHPEAVAKALNMIEIRFEEHSNRTLLNDIDVESEIRSPRISDQVSPVSTISAVRSKMVEQQRALAASGSIVMDGRDIGTVVFPEAELKIFLTANVKIRTQRRLDEMKRKGYEISEAEVMKNLKTRDQIDSTRADSPLSQAEDAVLIDNSNLSRKEQITMVLALARYRQKQLEKA